MIEQLQPGHPIALEFEGFYPPGRSVLLPRWIDGWPETGFVSMITRECMSRPWREES